MSFRFWICLFLTACASPLLVAAELAQGVAIPEDPSVAVIEMWYVDQGEIFDPEVAIFAGGRVQVRIGQGAIWGQLTRNQVEELVNSLLNEDGLARLTTDRISAEIREESIRNGLSCNIRGAGDTIIRIRTADKTYRLDGHAVGLLASRFPEATGNRQLYSAQGRLENVRAVVMVGGTPAAERLARLAQAKLQTESGERIIVRPQDLSTVHSLTDGTRCCQFLVPNADSTELSPRIVSLVESPGEVPRVSVLADGPSLQ
ncbi:hypothetical protein SH668x_003418 [Planctomicrobium sp. SH668]|uniref:hypothetical protein n=1 Tax=Planctomicrobium sp. SH668 TaxID=3448126 RepID=UPI003F5C7018